MHSIYTRSFSVTVICSRSLRGRTSIPRPLVPHGLIVFWLHLRTAEGSRGERSVIELFIIIDTILHISCNVIIFLRRPSFIPAVPCERLTDDDTEPYRTPAAATHLFNLLLIFPPLVHIFQLFSSFNFPSSNQ